MFRKSPKERHWKERKGMPLFVVEDDYVETNVVSCQYVW
jgi:hypothetical protein